jgi:hypothetical protein
LASTSLAGQKPLWQLEKSRESYHTLFLDSLYALAHAKPSENTLVHAPDKDDNEPNHQANDENPADPSDESHRAHGSTIPPIMPRPTVSSPPNKMAATATTPNNTISVDLDMAFFS